MGFKVSVIIPARNSEGTIGECVAAVLAQEFPMEGLEVIVVDDGSTDRTAEVARGAGARVLSIPPSGPAAARNRGAREASGEILAMTDADCVPDPGWLAALLAPFDDPEVSATKGVYRSEQPELTARWVQLEYQSRYRRMAARDSIDFLDTYSVAYRRELYLACGGGDESFPHPSTEDQELGFRYARQGGKISFVPAAVVRHRHAASPSGYARKKFRIGYWKVKVLERHPGKAASDSHTPWNVKVEMLAAMALTPALLLAGTGAGLWPALACLAAFAASGAPLAIEAFGEDARLGLAALGLLPLRALALGSGFGCGLLSRLLASGGILSLWAVAVAGLFCIASRPLLESAGGFLLDLGMLLLGAHLAWFTGWRILRRFASKLAPAGKWDPLERTLLEGGLGAGCLSALTFALGIAQLYSFTSAAILLAALAAGPLLTFWREARERWAWLWNEARRARGGFFLAALALVGGMTLIESLAPAAAQDALAYHLAVPAKYLERGGIHYLPESFFAQFPANVEMLFTLAMLLKGPSLAGACHWLLGAGAAGAAGALARRIAVRSGEPGVSAGVGPAPGVIASALFVTIPTAALIAGWAYIDLGVVFFQLLSTLAFLGWWEAGRGPAAAGPSGEESSPPSRAGWLLLSAVFAGLAAGCKYTGGAQALLLLAGTILEGGMRSRPLRAALASTALLAIVSGLTASPWWIKNLVYTGNPIFPFLHGILGGRDWDHERASVLSAFLGDWGRGEGGLRELLLLPLRLTLTARFFSVEKFDGVIGPAFLIGLPLVLSAIVSSREGGAKRRGVEPEAAAVLLLLAVGHAALWLCLSRQIRFLLPSLALFAALIGASARGAALQGALARGRWRGAALGALQLSAAANVLLIATHFATHNPLPVVLGLEESSRYLQREVPGGDYAVFRFVEESLPRECQILLGGCGNPGFLVKRPYHADAIFENRTLEEILQSGKTPEGVGEELRRRGFTHLLFRWSLVLDPSGKGSGIPIGEQQLLAEFLNRRGRLLVQAGGTVLYAVGVEP